MKPWQFLIISWFLIQSLGVYGSIILYQAVLETIYQSNQLLIFEQE